MINVSEGVELTQKKLWVLTKFFFMTKLKKEMKMEKTNIIVGLIVATGLAAGGFFPGYYYYQSQIDNRTVTVKGLSEMNVRADLAIWNIKFQATGDNLDQVQQKMAQNLKSVQNFLQEKKFSEAEITIGRMNTNDLNANPYREKYAGQPQFILSQTVVVRSSLVDQVEESVRQIGSLVGQGVVFNNDEYDSPVSYLFTKINDIKPKMLEESTKNARVAAEEFAKSSESDVGKIKRANQGVFSIMPREAAPNVSETSQIDKSVRVVSTVEYFID